MKKTSIILIVSLFIAASARGAAITIDVNLDRIPISDYIYGVNIYGDAAQPGTYPYLDPSINWGSRRLGGNRATGYNWENNASNAGADYGPNQSDAWWCTVYGTTNCTAPGALVSKFVNDCNTRGWEPLVTTQLAGFVSADSLGTNVTTTAVSGLTTDRWKTVQFAKGSAFTLTPNTSDEYVYMDEFVNWMVNQFGNASTATGVKMISMDNEPTLWDSTHPLIYPNNVTYLDLKNRTIALAQAIKNVDPNVLLFGAVDFGWSGFMNLNSAPDAATEGAGYTWFVDYYLDKLEAASAAYGSRLLDVLDIHWYPEDNGNNCRIVYTEYDGDCSNPTDYALNSAARMQAPRCLWDPTYTEDSWIPSPIRLIPRLQDSINTYYPGTKIAITEYDFGGGTHYSAGIAQADALGVFSEYGVFAAYLWDITPGNYTLAGVKLFRNYDGAMSTYGDTNVRANTSDVANLPVYASQDASDPSRLHIIAINRSGVVQAANIVITGPYGFSSGRVWAFDSTTYNITERTAIASITGNAFTYNVPAYTAMHMVLISNMLTPTFTQTINPLWTRTFTPTASPTFTVTPASILLDDCEDGNNTNNWGGAWYNYVSNTSTILPNPYVMTAPGMAGSANYCMSMTGNIAAGAYGGTGTNLNSGGTGVDLTGYTGVEFYAKGTGNYWFQLTQSAITGSYFGRNIAVSSTTAWTKFTVMFATDLTQRYGGPGTLTLNAIIALQWANNADGAMNLQVDDIRLIPASAMTPTNTPNITATRTPTRTPTTTASPLNTATRTMTVTATGSFTWTRTVSATAIITSTYTRTLTITATGTAVSTATFTGTRTQTVTYTRTATATESSTANASPSFTRTQTYTSTAASSPSFTQTRTLTVTGTHTRTATTGNTATYTVTGTVTNTPAGSLTFTPTVSVTLTFTGSFTRTLTLTLTLTITSTYSPTRTPTGTAGSSATSTPTNINTSTRTATATPTATYTQTSQASPSHTPTRTYTASETRTFTATVTPSLTYTASFTRTLTPALSPTNSATITQTGTGTPPSATHTATITRTETNVPTETVTPSNTAAMTATRTLTLTLTLTAASTFTRTLTLTLTAVPTNTQQGTATYTPSLTAPSSTVSPSLTYTASRTATASFTTVITATYTVTLTATMTGTITVIIPSNTVTRTATAAPTATLTFAVSAALEIEDFRAFPNPFIKGFSPAVNFAFTCTRTITSYTIDVYTASFRRVRSISGSTAGLTGNSTITVPGHKLAMLASGPYYCVLSAGDGASKVKSQPAVLIILK